MTYARSMGVVKHYSELVAWQFGIRLVKTLYLVTESWPDSERFGLISQIRRAAISIPSNIAEGHGRRSARDFARFLTIAYGSLMEVETQLHIAAELKYISANALHDCLSECAELGRVINVLLRSVNERTRQSAVNTV